MITISKKWLLAHDACINALYVNMFDVKESYTKEV